MRKINLQLIMILCLKLTAQAQHTTDFDVDRFEKALNKEMKIQFPWMAADTTLKFATRATSQEEAGYPECYGTKKGGMVNTINNEEDEAKLLVNHYKCYLDQVLHFNDQVLKRCRFTEFCASATKENGMVRYGIVVDNNFKREDLTGERAIHSH
jgi:hypothetical protein